MKRNLYFSLILLLVYSIFPTNAGCTDTISVNIEGIEDFCIDENLLDFSGNITSVIFCGQGNPATVLAAPTPDPLCLTLFPANGYFGTSPDLLCVVHCFNNDPAQCDSTFIEVTVLDCQLSATASTTPETCAGSDGSLEVLVSGANSSLVFQWSPPVATITNFASGLTNDLAYSVTATDGLGCQISLENLTVGNTCPVPQTQQINLVFECNDAPLAICASLNELTGNLTSFSFCQPPANGALTPSNDTCFTYVPNPGFDRADSTCIVVCDDFGICDTFLYHIIVEQCPQQVPCATISADTLVAQVSDCNEEVRFCISLPLGETLLYDFEVNGQPYAGNFSICEFDTLVSYGFSAIPGNGFDGPYDIVSWFVNGSNLGGGTFANISELIDLMNMLDPDGYWILDSLSFNISSFNTSSTYGVMTVQQVSTADLAMLGLNTATTPIGSALYLPVGTHEVIFTHQVYDFCVDTFTAIVHCNMPEIRFDSLLLGTSDTICLVDDLPGTPQSLTLNCPGCNNLSATAINSQCVGIQGLALGTDSLLLVSCDEFGLCDTTWLIVLVYDNGLPLANIDAGTTTSSTPIILSVLANDLINGTLVSMRLVAAPVHGQATLNSDFSMGYTPNDHFCGWDAFGYEICNENGCDTSAVEIFVRCTEVVVHTGFSPNQDGKNDTFTIQNIDLFLGNELRVFNRWGSLIFRSTNYSNDWDGSTFDEKILPDGTYFYVLELTKGDIRSGYLQLQR